MTPEFPTLTNSVGVRVEGILNSGWMYVRFQRKTLSTWRAKVWLTALQLQAEMPICEVNDRPARQQTLRLSWNPKAHHRCHKIVPPDLTVGQRIKSTSSYPTTSTIILILSSIHS